ncbi:MAG: TRAP transporter substrate-binding protein [Burkholderiales bacterium]
MQKRTFLKASGAGLAAAAIATPGSVTAQSQPSIKWRLASSAPKSLDTVFGAAELFASRVKALTDGKFEIRVFAAGEIVPGLQVLDACQQGSVECGQTSGYYYIGKNRAFAFDSALPFGLNARQQNAWLYVGGGLELMRDLYKEYNVINFPGGNTGTQMGGWFRTEIRSVADMKGLKVRVPGMAGEVMSQLGAVPQTIAGGDIYPALEKGTIDAAEWVGPYDDEKLGFYRVAPHYYFSGWWEGSSTISFLVNLKEWAKLPRQYQQAIEVGAAEANVRMIATYDAKNPPALARLVAAGAKLHPFPNDLMLAALKVATRLYEEEASRNPTFKKIFASWKQFRYAQFQWYRIAEATFSNFMASQKL